MKLLALADWRFVTQSDHALVSAWGNGEDHGVRYWARLEPSDTCDALDPSDYRVSANDLERIGVDEIDRAAIR